MKRYYEKYKHIMPLAIFGVIYVLWFYLLEHRTNVQYMVVHMNIDDYIPFCEYFVVPYLLWFAYVPAVLGYLFFKDRRNYDRCAVFLCTGMLIFFGDFDVYSEYSASAASHHAAPQCIYGSGESALADGYADQPVPKYSCI